MPWRALLSDPGADPVGGGARATARALRDLALLAEQLTEASAVALCLAPDWARQLDLTDCLIGPEEGVAALMPLAADVLAGFSAPPGARTQPQSCAPLVTDRRIGPGSSGLARALFLSNGACVGVLALSLPATIGAGVNVADEDRTGQGLDLLAATAETLLNGRLRQLEVRQGLVACRTEMETLRRISERDPLTGLANIAAFETRSRALLRDSTRPALLVLLDMDHFKAINDLYGHQFGDLCLKTVAGAVRDGAPEGAVVGRLGGDEFGVMLPLPAPLDRAGQQEILSGFTSRILRATAPLDKPGLGRVSIGAAHFPHDAGEYGRLYSRADLALYASKSQGRGGATLYDTEVGERFDYTELAKNFRDACRSGQVVPYFQPMVDLETGQPQIFEVLCRWNNPRHGLMAPETFSSIFTDHEFASHLTRHMARSSLAVFARARDGLPEGAKLSLNLTYFDLMDREFVFDLQLMLAENGIAWGELVAEVQETVVMDDENGQIFRTLSELRRRGVEIALDDFGTGYGALKHLRSWPVDMLKIDRSFVDGICTSRRDRAIVASILQLSQDLGFRVVAEGVETAAQAALLREMGCDLGQGFGLGRPVGPQGLIGGACAGGGDAAGAAADLATERTGKHP